MSGVTLRPTSWLDNGVCLCATPFRVKSRFGICRLGMAAMHLQGIRHSARGDLVTSSQTLRYASIITMISREGTMIGEGRHQCRSCRAILRRGHTSALCDPCARAAHSYDRCLVPEGFYDLPALREALAKYDFGPVFRAVRRTVSLSQEELGFLIGLSQARVSDVERGARRLRDVATVARIARVMGIPPRFLGFDPLLAGSVDGHEEVNWMDRRDFINAVTALTLGVGAYPDLERLERLEWLLLTRDDPPAPRRIGASDVTAIEETTAAFRLSHRRHGGGLSRAAAVAQLGYVLKLRDAECSEQVRADLLLATADLALIAAWMTYDVEQHEDARRLWMIALNNARQANHPLSTDLTVYLLQEMAHQALHIGRPDEALRLVQLGATMATNGTYPVSASTRGYNTMNLARCRASMGEAEPCHRAMDQALQTYTDTDPASVPPWAAFIATPLIATQQGHTLSLLSQTNPGYAPTAIEHLHSGIDSYNPTHTRSRAINLPWLAGSYFHAGEVDSAVRTGHEAVTVISTLSSKRAHTGLRILAETAEPHSHHPDVAELRERIRETLTTAA